MDNQTTPAVNSKWRSRRGKIAIVTHTEASPHSGKPVIYYHYLNGDKGFKPLEVFARNFSPVED